MAADEARALSFQRLVRVLLCPAPGAHSQCQAPRSLEYGCPTMSETALPVYML